MKRYQINQQGLQLEDSQALYRTALGWAAARGDSFVLGMQPGIYDDPQDVARLKALGQVKAHPVPDDIVSRFLGRFSHDDSIQVEGATDEAFIRELTRTPAPLRAVSGNESPVDYVIVQAGERPLYVSYDYGSVQTFDLTDEEVESLRQTLAQAGLEADRVVLLSA